MHPTYGTGRDPWPTVAPPLPPGRVAGGATASSNALGLPVGLMEVRYEQGAPSGSRSASHSHQRHNEFSARLNDIAGAAPLIGLPGLVVGDNEKTRHDSPLG
jgi:hypothetical protein